MDEATAAIDDGERLRDLRFENLFGEEKSRRTRSSLERRVIWEPVIALWCDLGHALHYSRTGPIMRIVNIIHLALGIRPPSPDT